MHTRFQSNSYALDKALHQGLTAREVELTAFADAIERFYWATQRLDPSAKLPTNIRVELRKQGWDVEVRLYLEGEQ